jgi:two-component system NtrC family response regulator
MADASIIEPKDLGFKESEGEQIAGGFEELSLREARDRLEGDMVAQAIERQGGNIVKAAEMLGVSRPTIYDLMKKHGLHGG